MQLKTLILMAGTALALSSPAWADNHNETESEAEAVSGVDGTYYGIMTLGEADAPAVLVEFASVTCGHCAAFHHEILPELKPRIEAGELRYELHEFPTPPARLAIAGFMVARCSGDDQYFDVIDYLFDNQADILAAARRGEAADKLIDIASEFDLSEDDFDACLGDEKLFDTIEDIVDAGSDRGVNATPTLFMNGEKVTGENYSAAGLNSLIDDLNATED